MHWRTIFIIGGIGSFIFGSLGWILWVWLPEWAPKLTFEYSPFLEQQWQSTKHSKEITAEYFFDKHHNAAIPYLINGIHLEENESKREDLINDALYSITQHTEELEAILLKTALSAADETANSSIWLMLNLDGNCTESLTRIVHCDNNISKIQLGLALAGNFEFYHDMIDETDHLIEEDLINLHIDAALQFDGKAASLVLYSLRNITIHLRSSKPELLPFITRRANDIIAISDKRRKTSISESWSCNASAILLMTSTKHFIVQLSKYGLDQKNFEIVQDVLGDSGFNLERSQEILIGTHLDDNFSELSNDLLQTCALIDVFPDQISKAVIKQVNKINRPAEFYLEYLEEAGFQLKHLAEMLTLQDEDNFYISHLIKADNIALVEHLSRKPWTDEFILDLIRGYPAPHIKNYVKTIQYISTNGEKASVRNLAQEILLKHKLPN